MPPRALAFDGALGTGRDFWAAAALAWSIDLEPNPARRKSVSGESGRRNRQGTKKTQNECHGKMFWTFSYLKEDSSELLPLLLLVPVGAWPARGFWELWEGGRKTSGKKTPNIYWKSFKDERRECD